MLTTLVTTSQLEEHAVHLGVLAYALIIGVLLTVMAIADARRNRRSHR